MKNFDDRLIQKGEGRVRESAFSPHPPPRNFRLRVSLQPAEH